MIRRPPRSTLSSSSAASDVYKRQVSTQSTGPAPRAMGIEQSVESHYYLDRGCDSEFSMNPEGFLTSLFKEGQDTAGFALGGRQVVAVRGMEGSRLFHDPSSPVTAIGALPAHLATLYGEGTYPVVRSLLLTEGEAHHKAKKELNLALTAERLTAHCSGIAKLMAQAAAQWAGTTEQLSTRCDQLALQASARCCLGITDASKVQQLANIAAGFSVFDVSGDPAVAAAVRDALLSVIDEQTECENAPGDASEDSVLDVLMHAADSMSCEVVEIVTLHLFLLVWKSLARAFEATVKALSEHEHMQAALAAEALQALQANPECTPFSAVLVGSTKQLSFFVKEVKRTTLVAPLPWRRLTAPYDIGPAHLEADTIVCLATHLVHADSTQYSAAHKFDPSRFGKDRAEDKKNNGWCWVPHGTGSKAKGHRCASEELSTGLMKSFCVLMFQNKWKLEGSALTVHK
eukprot:TRINITY_DN491_c0_g1_i1.p1 TRINITY_DN491_c0_g1~~TRINITY_DN491_c0_g1_i1.p1  ORF type:complete len:459 (-),score=139.43 TRINITY_DN491_c0_g1_i1:229-1605(-)